MMIDQKGKTMSLKETLAQKNNRGIPFMEDREKGEMKGLTGQKVTIIDYDFIEGDEGQFVAFVIKEDKKRFYFGGKVITSDLQELTLAEKIEVRESGLPVLFENKKSKKGRDYISVTYYPDEEKPPFDLD